MTASATRTSRPVAYGSAFYGFLAILLSIAIARRIVGHGRDTAILIWFGTPLVFYTHIAPVFSHACSACAVALFIWTWLNVRERWSVRGMMCLGAAAALMAMVREQDAFIVAGPAIDVVRWLVQQYRVRETRALALREFAIAALAGCAAFLVCYLPQLIAYKALNGHFGPDNVVARKMFWSSPRWFDVLFDREHGLFAWTPLAALAIAGLVVLASSRRALRAPDSRWLGVVALVMIATQIYVNGAVASWTVAGGFGQRRFISITPLLVLGLAALWHGWSHHLERPMRTAATVLVVLSVWWNIGLIIQFGDHRMDRQRLTLASNAWQTFVVLPRDAPSLVWRYFTNRASFYQPHAH